MNHFKEKLTEWSRDKALIRIALGLVATLLILLIAFCISNNMRSHIQSDYSQLVAHMQEETYAQLKEMTELFSGIDAPEADVRGELLPALQGRYNAARALTNALIDSGRAKDAILTSEQLAALDRAFEDYFSAYRRGVATGLAKADLAECIADVSPIVEMHYNPPVDEKDKILVIDAASGEVTKVAA